MHGLLCHRGNYLRHRACTQVQMLSWQRLPENSRVYVYVPYAPAVVTKFGKDDAGYPLCSGPPPG